MPLQVVILMILSQGPASHYVFLVGVAGIEPAPERPSAAKEFISLSCVLHLRQ